MILADTSVWIDHLRRSLPALGDLLNDGQVLMHRAVLGEIALGSLRQRDMLIRTLADLPRADAADDDEVLGFITRHQIFGLGIGWIDAHLLAAARLSRDTKLWTRDRRLRAAAETLGLAAAMD